MADPADILEKRLSGERLSRSDAGALLDVSRLNALGAAANEVARGLHPDRVTYVVDRNVNYTNICEIGCRFCAFWRAKGRDDAYVLDRETLYSKVREALDLGATQLLLQGGHNPDLDIEWYEALLTDIRARFDINIHGLSPPEVAFIAENSGISVKETLSRLKDAGLGSLPGGGAEILVDRVRERISPRKLSADGWLDVMRTAHRMGLRTTATMMFGAGESPADRVEHMLRLRELQDGTGGFTAFIPWSFQPRNTSLGGVEATGAEYLGVLALSRLMLDNFANIQASWVTQGSGMAQAALFYGANDFGSTMIEENVVAATGASYSMTEAEMVRAIASCGFVPAKRDTFYNILEVHEARGKTRGPG